MKKTPILLLLALLTFVPMAWAQQTNVNYIDAYGEPQTASAYLIKSSSTVLGMQYEDIWYYVQGNVEINSQVTYISNINLILCDGASLTINTTNEDAIHCSASNSTLTIYGQTSGTGQLTATATSSSGIYTEYFTIHGGVINASGSSNGIYANKTLVINRGTVTANGNDWGMRGDVVTINGGNVTANGGGIWSSGMTSTLTIGYTNSSDRIYSTKYQSGYTGNMMRVKSGQYMKTTDTNFIIYGKVNDDWKDAIASHTLMPYTPTEWRGKGTSSEPYIIASVDDLNLLSIRTNGGTHPYSDTCFKLGANITFTASSDWNDASSTESNFTAIPTFSGHFDGDVYTISGLRIYANDNFHDQNGLFTNLGPNAYIEDVTLSNARITGQTQIGAIAGYVNGGATITNCHVTGTVTVHAKGHTLENHGGIVGINYGTISNCVSEATISRGSYTLDNGKAGGIAGTNAGTLSNNKVFNANITAASSYGAIAGLNNGGTLTNNYYHACTVNGTANTVNIGVNGADITTSDGALPVFTVSVPDGVTAAATATVTYNTVNYYKQGVTVTLSGGLVGTPGEGLQYAYIVYGETLTGSNLAPGHEFDMQNANAVVTIGSMSADWAVANEGTQADPYKIYYTDQLDQLAARVNNGTSTYSNKYFKLMDDLTYSYTGAANENNYTAIGNGSNPFSGHFDGNQKTINGIRIYTNSGYQGVFGYIVDAEVKDLYVNDIMISGHDRVGSIVGECDGSSAITNCRVTTATLTATGDSYNQQLFGGIAGRNSGTSTMSNNFVLGINIPHIYHFGAIAGENGGSLVSNYYHNYIMNGTAYPTGMGCNGGDVGGAEPVFTVSVPDGVTATATATASYNEVNYYKEGVTVTLSGGLDGSNPNPGCQNAYVVYGQTLTGSNLAPGHDFDMQNANAVVTIGSMIADWATEQGAGDTEGNPYKIYYKEQLDLLATRVNAGESYSGKYFKLMDDLTYDNTQQNNYIAIGTSTHPFSGHFNGNQKTINGVRINSTGGYLGVFGYINNSEVKDLYVNDIVITGHDRVGSIVGECDGGTTITGCRVTTATLNVAGDATYQQLFGGIAGRKSGSTMSNNFVIGITIPQVYHTGAIAGENGSSSQSLVSNYYHNCTVGSTPYPTGIGCNAIDVEGAKPVFSLTLADGISIDVTPAVRYNMVDYYEAGVTINLSYVTPANPGYRHIYSVNNTPIANYGTSFDISTNSEVTVAPNILINWETEYAGTETDPYLISNVEQWDMLASNVSISGIHYSGEYFKLTENISVTEMVGTSSNKFSGTFDGNGQTLTFNQNNATEQYIAPFRYINSATIQNLKVAGTVTSSNKFAGGVVAHATGSNTIANCVNSTIINATIEGNGSHGGILGQLGVSSNSVTISGCVFNGKMLGTNTDYWCGIIGYFGSNSVTISNCFFSPEEINVKATNNNYTICRSGSSVNNCYYNTEAAEMHEKQGQLAHSITTNDENISIGIHGVASSQTTIGVIGYDPGIKYDGVHYASSDETVSLLLDYTEPGYDASHYYANGTEIYLSPNFNSYTLNMPNEDVIITADATLTTIYREIEGYGNGNDHWAFIASPVEGSIEPTEVSGLIADPATYYDLYRLNPTNTIWENYKEHEGNAAPNFTLKNGRGYLYATKETKTLAFTGTFNTGTSKEITDLPAGFNLVGNPFTVDAYVSKPYYTLNSDGSAILTETSSNAIPPCYGIIVEVNENETVRFNTTGVFGTGPNNGGLNVALTQANTRSNAVMDNAIVSFNEDSQLGKFYFGTQDANIYIPQDGEEYAIAFSEGQGEMPVNFKANKNGTYTLSVNPEGIEMAYLHLVDNMTGNDIDLLAGASTGSATYTFTAKTTDYESRFRLVFATNNEDGPSTGSGTFAFFSNGNWIIANEGKATLQVIDINGRILTNETVNGSVSKAINAAPGVYVIRLINGNDVKTQKIVVE